MTNKERMDDMGTDTGPLHIVIKDESEEVIGEFAMGIDTNTNTKTIGFYFGDGENLTAYPEWE